MACRRLSKPMGALVNHPHCCPPHFWPTSACLPNRSPTTKIGQRVFSISPTPTRKVLEQMANQSYTTVLLVRNFRNRVCRFMWSHRCLVPSRGPVGRYHFRCPYDCTTHQSLQCFGVLKHESRCLFSRNQSQHFAESARVFLHNRHAGKCFETIETEGIFLETAPKMSWPL